MRGRIQCTPSSAGKAMERKSEARSLDKRAPSTALARKRARVYLVYCWLLIDKLFKDLRNISSSMHDIRRLAATSE